MVDMKWETHGHEEAKSVQKIKFGLLNLTKYAD